MARKFAAVVFSVGCLHASSALALGLGELSLESFLNEPLKAKVDLLNTDGLNEDQIRIRLATKDDFKKMGIDRAYFLTNITFEVDVDASGRGHIILTSQDPVLEPYLDFIVEARWPSGRLLREYTILVDPPVFDSVNPVVSASERVEAVEGIPAPAKKPSGAKSGSGTRVDIKESDLAPGAMPARDYSESAAGQPSAGERYMINRNDTLWKIAVKGKPPGVSVHQAMLDIQRLNPNAFIDGNINRIKAGYIIYLPDSSDISSADEGAAVAEVKQQNQDWREGVASQPAYSSGPSLRISGAGDDDDDENAPAKSGSEAIASASGSAALEDLEKSELERAEMAERLGAMTQQVETLQRIVNLKDDQIAALQDALSEESADSGDNADQGAQSDGAAALLDADSAAAVEDSTETAEAGSAAAADSSVPAAEEASPATATPETTVAPAETAAAQPAADSAQDSGGMMGYLKYIIGAAVAGLLALFFIRRRGTEEEQEPVRQTAPIRTAAESPAEDVFADIELQDQELDLDESEPETVLLGDELELTEQEMPIEEDPSEGERTSRGYGGRKHDEYASDVDTGDALAEADIYIAYGRFPQAIDLLHNALKNEPNNPAFHLKLLEIHAEAEDSVAAMEQFSELKAIGDAASLARAEEVLAGIGAGVASASAADSGQSAPAKFDDLALEDTDLTVDTGEVLEADFAGLEIEETSGDDAFPDELDLSADFETAETAVGDSEEDLVIAAETNGFSTKLDLARAYLDMGDEDGARQILQEVEAEGSDSLKAEAQALLARIV